MATKKRAKSSTPPGSANRTAKEKHSHLTFENQNLQPGWTQKEVDYLVSNVPGADQRTSVKTGTETFKGGDKPVDGTAYKTKKGKVLEK
jgi:hypothetical protein